jgi:NitT/TauT family transport system permease protein
MGLVSTSMRASGLDRRYGLMARSLGHFLRHDMLAALLAIVAAAGVWQVVSLFYTAAWLPPPASVVAATQSLLTDPDFRGDLLLSLGAAGLGFGIAVVVGGAVGFMMAVSRLAEMALRFYVDALLIVPSVMLAPVLVVIFGINWLNVIALSTLFGTSIIAINSAAAVRCVDRTWVEVGQVMGASRGTLVRRFMIPGILPQFFGGLHLGVARAFKGMVIGQVFLGVIGIGGYLARFQQGFDGAGIWSVALLLIASALVTTWTVKAVDHVVNFWAYRD